MKFKEIDVEIQDDKFTVREGTLEETLPVLSKFSDPDADKLLNQLELLKLVVYQNGDRLGDKVGGLPQSYFLKLGSAALEVCGMSGPADEDGEG